MDKLELEDVLPHQWDEWTGRGPDEWRGRVDWEGTNLLTRLAEAAMSVPLTNGQTNRQGKYKSNLCLEDGRQIFANIETSTL